VHVRDTDGDGHPDYDWRTANIAPKTGLPRLPTVSTNLVVNTADTETLLTPALPWAYLGMVSYGYDTSSPASTGQPPIQIDWTSGQILFVGEFVSSRANENQWFTYSYYPLKAGETNQPNFESPFAWYDLR